MLENKTIRRKSYDFALSIVKLCQEIQESRNEHILSNHLMRCGTSIGANIEEAIHMHNKKDYYLKLDEAYKETISTNYWINLLFDSGYVDTTRASLYRVYIEELLEIIEEMQSAAQGH